MDSVSGHGGTVLPTAPGQPAASGPAQVLTQPVPARPAPARADPTMVLTLVGVGAALVIALWWRNTPSVSGLGDWLTNAGRITGLLTGYAVVVLLALMARVPLLDRGLGTDRLARWHSMGGRYVIGLASAHALLIIWGYAVTAHDDPVHQTWTLLTAYPDVLMTTVALGLLLGVAFVSARAVRRRLRYETWYYLHLYTYLAVALAFSHQFADGAEFISSRPSRVAWSALYLGVAALLLWYRLLAPVRQAFRHGMRVVRVRPEAPGVISVLVEGRHLDELRTEPGQFFRWRFLTRQTWWSANPYSLSAPPHPRLLRITVQQVGDHSRILHRLRPGTRVLAEGPFGALTPARRTRRKVLLVAGGIGITPLRALFEALPAGPGDLTLVYRAHHPGDLVFRAELDAIAAARGAVVHYLPGPRGSQADVFATGALPALVPGLAQHDVYVCGPAGMTAAAVAALRAAGVPRRHIHTEDFEF